ncbi:hypothetical protein [Dyadobacter sp. 3J3]|uniref:hypothetical protein n=1 Tax=Dyadobacter sp. 3J3 TaxID=2606600 RepID=UPI00135B6D0D|nr:hypothetical protein [Dyadobacter sp. 3J3]
MNEKTMLPPKIRSLVKEKRPLNDKEKALALTLSAAVHYLIRSLDEMEYTDLYKHKLKLVAKAFTYELENHAKSSLWGNEVEGTDLNKVNDQMEDIVQMFGNLLMIGLSMGEIHKAQQTLFWQEMQKQFKRFDVPLMLTPEGDLHFINPETSKPSFNHV